MSSLLSPHFLITFHKNNKIRRHVQISRNKSICTQTGFHKVSPAFLWVTHNNLCLLCPHTASLSTSSNHITQQVCKEVWEYLQTCCVWHQQMCKYYNNDHFHFQVKYKIYSEVNKIYLWLDTFLEYCADFLHMICSHI